MQQPRPRASPVEQGLVPVRPPVRLTDWLLSVCLAGRPAVWLSVKYQVLYTVPCWETI